MPVTRKSPRSNRPAGRPPRTNPLRIVLLSLMLLAAHQDACAQELSAFPETPRPVRRIDAAPPISLSDSSTTNPPGLSAEPAKTPIRRLADASPTASAPRSPWAMWMVLIGIVAAAVGMSWWARRGGAGTAYWKLPSTVFQVLGRSTVGANQSVTLLRLGERVLLVSSSGPAMQTLAVITDPAEVAAITSECHTRRSPHVAEIPQQRSRKPGSTEFRPVAGTIGDAGLLQREVGHA